jgi:two-component system response regulator FixJ
MAEQQNLHGTEIFVVDDDEAMRDALSAVLAPEGCRVTCFAEGQSFLTAARERTPACILLDVNMPGRSGLDMLRELDALHYPAPILIVSGQRDVPTAVNAIRGGALDFIEKPIVPEAVVARVREAIGAWVQRPANGNGHMPEVKGADRLTPREREVMAEVIAGASNKEAGRKLRISPRTVEVHRARIMDKIGARNAADLVRIALGQGARH